MQKARNVPAINRCLILHAIAFELQLPLPDNADRLQVMGSWPGAVWQDMGSAVLATISGAPDGTVWGTDGNNALLRFNGTAWDTMPGQAKQVSVGSSTVVWSIDVNGNAQRWTGSGWEAHGNPGSALTSIAALGDGTVLATATVARFAGISMGEIFTWDGKTWTASGVLADQIAGTDAAHLAGNRLIGLRDHGGQAGSTRPPGRQRADQGAPARSGRRARRRLAHSGGVMNLPG